MERERERERERGARALPRWVIEQLGGVDTTVTLNLTKSEPMETRHLELSKDKKFEQNGAWKGLQTVV